jgi:predicted esterase
LPAAVVVGLLRPGYTDGAGHTSDGERGRATGDNYTPQVIDAVREVVVALRKEYDTGPVVLVGHSGGAAIAADLLGRWPGEVDAALLISCPCNVWAWRTHMMKSYAWPYGPMALVFKLPTDSLSPLDLADRVSPRVAVRMLVGENDDVAPPALTREYEAALKRHGANVRVTIAPALPHDILLEPVAFEELQRLVELTQQEPRP